MNVLFDLSIRVSRHFINGSGAFVSSSLAPRAASPRPGIFKDATSDETAGGDARGLEPAPSSSSRQRPADSWSVMSTVAALKESVRARRRLTFKKAQTKRAAEAALTSTIVMPAKAGIQ
jgi:hypothetical protein